MGWFSKAVPERKWPEVSADLGLKLKAASGSWYSTFQHGTASRSFALPPNAISATANRYIHMMQLAAVAATLQENSYVSDLMFFLELVYIHLTDGPPANLHRDIEALPFALAGDAQKSLILWSQSMASELLPGKDDPVLLEELNRYGSLLVVQAKIATCQACGDHKGAEKIRSSFGDKA